MLGLFLFMARFHNLTRSAFVFRFGKLDLVGLIKLILVQPGLPFQQITIGNARVTLDLLLF